MSFPPKWLAPLAPKVVGTFGLLALMTGCAGTTSPPDVPRPPVRAGLSFVQADRDGRWLVACRPGPLKPREGENPSPDAASSWIAASRLEPYLFWPSGPGELLDDYVSSDPSGRYLVVVQRGKLVLIDAVTGIHEDLSAKGADARDDVDSWSFSHRAASFDEEGRLVYWRRSTNEKAPPTLVVRFLDVPRKTATSMDIGKSSSTEIEIPLGHSPGPGPFRAWLDGDWVVLRPVRNGRLGPDPAEKPIAWTPRARVCTPVSMGCVLPSRIENAALVPIDGGPSVPLAEGMLVVGDELVRKSPDGALESRTAHEPDFHPRVPASCGGRLLASYHGKWLVACTAEGPERPPLRFYARGAATPVELALRVSLRDHRSLLFTDELLIPVSWLADKATDLYLDMESGRVHAFRGSLVFGFGSRRGLVRTRENDLYWFDLDQGREVLLTRLEPPRPYERDRYERTFIEGPWAFVWPYLVDLDRGSIVGTFARKNAALELSQSGRLLVRRDRSLEWKAGESLTDLFEWIAPENLTPFVPRLTP
jgi:hypothetical protein